MPKYRFKFVSRPELPFLGEGAQESAFSPSIPKAFCSLGTLKMFQSPSPLRNSTMWIPTVSLLLLLWDLLYFCLFFFISLCKQSNSYAEWGLQIPQAKVKKMWCRTYIDHGEEHPPNSACLCSPLPKPSLLHVLGLVASPLLNPISLYKKKSQGHLHDYLRWCQGLHEVTHERSRTFFKNSSHYVSVLSLLPQKVFSLQLRKYDTKLKRTNHKLLRICCSINFLPNTWKSRQISTELLKQDFKLRRIQLEKKKIQQTSYYWKKQTCNRVLDINHMGQFLSSP